MLAATAALRVMAERELIARTMARDRRFFAASWIVLLEHAPPGEVDQMVESLERHPMVRAQHIEMSVDDAQSARARALAMPLHQRERLAAGRVASGVVGDRFRTLVPVGDSGLFIDLDEPLVGERLERLHHVSAVVSSTALLAATALLVWWLVRRLVARPLEALGLHARAVGAGHLDLRLDLPETTELGALASEVNEMTEQLEEARVALRALEADRAQLEESLRHADRLRTAGQLSAALAHEIGTPLHVVIGRAQLIQHDDESSEASREGAAIVVREGRRIADLVRRLLGFVRRAGEPDRPQPLASTVRRALDLVDPVARQRAIDVAFMHQLPEDERVSRADEIVQVVTNLVVNAIQAGSPGHRIEVHARVVHDAAPYRWVELAVVDRGPGLDASILSHLFEPFFTTKPEDLGTGLGLSVVRGIVEERGGTIVYETTEGGGATFRVTLPSRCER